MKYINLLIVVLVAGTMAPTAWADQCGPARGVPGKFDYFLLSLSWAPAYCATSSGKANPQECGPGTNYGFVVHVLWPQYTNGTWPQCCQAVAPVRESAVLTALSAVMIGDSLRQHEWDKHGSCVTTVQDDYFGKIQRAVDAFGLAPGLTPASDGRIKVSKLKAYWSAVPAGSITTQCSGNGRSKSDTLSEVHICLDGNLTPIACPAAEVKADNCLGSVVLQGR